ncbi:ABC-2 type transport system permease protein [Methylobacillus rhizosphaerae]|uniref:ABC-2 type transport system permease protein n=1 Tax=Methylobacillus rhizosphaerae TaxID=551994 RepID=A0A239AEQ6_9PROT|nr:ABC transporter permease [Methylobacillus rhizosphaerae]SNR93393.1 ABC-2 type transport system permease protein [Methylobacillus rhizosphaerae]
MIVNIARKELKGLFSSPMGWVILALLQFVFATFFVMGVDQYFLTMSGMMRPDQRMGVTEFVGASVFGVAPFIMLFAVPLLSMRLISEERRQQTLTFLFSAPLSLTEIVLGKFFGLLAFLSASVFLIALMVLSLNLWADIDFGYLFANLLGLLLLVASYCALGTYVSSTTQQPVVAAIITFVALLALQLIEYFLSGDPSNTLANLSLMRHLEPFSRGLLDTRDIAYFLLFIITFLTLTVRRLDADRLRG